MMAPLPSPAPSSERPELPRARVEVRAGGGRAVTYEIGSDEFLVGPAAGCDLRLPLPGTAPVALQFLRRADGLKVRRLAPTLTVLLNNTPVPANTPTPVAHHDRITVGDVELTVAVDAPAYLSPKLVPLPVEPPSKAPAPVSAPDKDELAARVEEVERREAGVVRRQRDLDRQTEELEADRALWYARRQEMEEEAAVFRKATAALPAREQEAERVRGELAALREKFARELQEQRDRLAADRAEFEAELDTRRAAVETDVLARYRAKMEELDRSQAAVRDAAAHLAARREQAEDERAGRLREVDGEIARRRAALDAELARHAPALAELTERQARLDAAFADLDRQRAAFAADQEILARGRETFEAERAAEFDRLASRESVLNARESDLSRREGTLQTDRETFDQDRSRLNDDLLRLDRRRAEIEDRDQALASREREAELHLEQLKRDAAEWEETVRLVAAEQERQRAEAERLDRARAELDAQTARLSERAAQLEAQQGVLAVARARLDRTREDVEREAGLLAAARVREDAAHGELRDRIREAEQLRAELSTVQATAELERQRLDEQDTLLAAGLAELNRLKEAVADDEARLRGRETELDARSAEFAEQAGALKGRMGQALDLQARLEADRVALREREAALARAEEARAALQEQLRKRAEDLAARSAALDEAVRKLAADQGAIDQARAAVAAEQAAAGEAITLNRADLDTRAADLERQTAAITEREAALARQVVKLKDVGQAVAAERKALADARATWDTDRRAAIDAALASRAELDSFRARAAAEFAALQAEAPRLEEQAGAAAAKLTDARDALRGHLAELNDFARQSRDDLEVVRAQVRTESDRLREQEAALDRARAEHRLAVTEFRQQLVDWQARVAEMKRLLLQGESRLDARQAEVDQAARQAEATTVQLAEQAELLRREREEVVQRRTEVERHLADMREWYRRKLREVTGTESRTDEPPALKIHDATPDDLEPGDRQLGELLKSLDLVDADTLTALWAEAGRQRRTLRQMLLASGAVTLYQLALIEAGNLDGLMLGRFRVIDRLRAAPRETLYRALDPTRATAPGGGVFLLRQLAEGEMQDAVRPDEFRQRFAAARDAAHPNLAAVVEVLDLNGRPAVVQEWLTGLFSADWPPQAAHPGCWVRLATTAAEGIDAAHRAGLAHGRLTSDSFVLTAAGVVKVTGFGEPPWLASGPVPGDATPEADLRAFGQVLFGWSQLAAKKKGARPKPFPPELVAIVRRLEADPEPPMADTVAPERPYASAAELVADLKRVARDTAFSDDAWDKLLRHVAENAPDTPAALRQSA